MTRLFTDGAEMGDTVFWTANGGWTASNSSPTPRSGSYCYKVTTGYIASKSFTPITEGYLRFGINVSNWRFPNDMHSPSLRNSATVHLALGVAGSSDGRLTLTNAAYTVLGTGTAILTQNVWHLIEMYFKIDDSVGRCVIYLNGNKEIDYTGDTRNGTPTTVDNVYYWYNMGGAFCLDDLALNSTDNSDGKNDNSWCGNGYVVYLPANANGDVNNWLNSSGNKTNNYTYVDEIPSNSDTDYVSASVVGLQDMYNVGEYSLTNKVVKRIWAESRSKDTSYTSKGIKLGIKTGSSVFLSSASTALPGIYNKVTAEEHIVNPATGLSWTESEINSIQFVQEAS